MEFDKFITIKGNTYYLQPINEQGVIRWKTMNGHKYYFNSNGIMQTGVQTINRLQYYFSPTTGKQKAGIYPTSVGLDISLIIQSEMNIGDKLFIM